MRYRKSIPVIRDNNDTLDYILENKCSVSRYGDGEIDVIYNKGNYFTKPDEELGRRLAAVLESDIDRHIVCIPYTLKSLRQFRGRSRWYWRGNLLRTLPLWLSHLRKDKIYYSSFITRFYISYRDKSHARRYIDKFRQIWGGRDIVIVEGEATRMGVGNDLFDNTNSIRRILCPAMNAYNHYGEILSAALEHGKGRLVLIALGQTATVLAYDLCKSGIQALDLGHIDIEYEWMLAGATEKTAIKNKFVNEVENGREISPIRDSIYESQIITRIDCV